MLYGNRATDVLKARPRCDICGSADAAVDGKTRMGPWGYLCNGCFSTEGVGLGMGRGQVLLCGDALDSELVRHYKLEGADAQ
jgi:hypothetical protein